MVGCQRGRNLSLAGQWITTLFAERAECPLHVLLVWAVDRCSDLQCGNPIPCMIIALLTIGIMQVSDVYAFCRVWWFGCGAVTFWRAKCFVGPHGRAWYYPFLLAWDSISLTSWNRSFWSPAWAEREQNDVVFFPQVWEPHTTCGSYLVSRQNSCPRDVFADSLIHSLWENKVHEWLEDFGDGDPWSVAQAARRLRSHMEVASSSFPLNMDLVLRLIYAPILYLSRCVLRCLTSSHFRKHWVSILIF